MRSVSAIGRRACYAPAEASIGPGLLSGGNFITDSDVIGLLRIAEQSYEFHMRNSAKFLYS